MTTLLPDSKRAAASFAEWIDYVRHRLAQATRLDPWRGMAPVVMSVGTRRDTLLLRAAIASGAAALVAIFLLPWVFAVALGAAAILLGAWVLLAMRRHRRRELARTKESVVALGAVVMANMDLFDPEKPGNLPGVLLVTLDPKLMAGAPELQQLVDGLFELKNQPLDRVPAELRAIAEQLTSERGWFEPLRVPRSFCGNDQTVLHPCWFVRKLLPRNCIDRRIFPVLVHARMGSGDLEMLPLEMWWRADFDAAFGGEFGLGVTADST